MEEFGVVKTHRMQSPLFRFLMSRTVGHLQAMPGVSSLLSLMVLLTQFVTENGTTESPRTRQNVDV